MESGQHRPLTAAEVAIKKSTDCIYFLASPLTCKKGKECDFRHCEGARVNPRDCYYWLHSNCLNPKCSFRHPPLDGLFGTPGTNPGLAPPPSQTIASTQIPMVHAPIYNLNKQSVPCIYFQKGQCLKGDRCPFTHTPQKTVDPSPHEMKNASSSLPEQPQTDKKNSWGLKQCSSQQSIRNGSVNQPVEALLSAENCVSRTSPNNMLHKRKLLSYPLGNKLSGSQPRHARSNNSVLSKCRDHQVHALDVRPRNGRVAEDLLRRPPPRFDALINNNIQGNSYSYGKDDFQRTFAESERKQKPVSNHDHYQSDYEHVPRYERDKSNGSVGEFEQLGEVRDCYKPKSHRISSDRVSGRSLLPERRLQPRNDNPDEVDGSDLRHQLAMHRRHDDSRSVCSPFHRGQLQVRHDHSGENRYLGHHSRRDYSQIPLESSISTRLQGRITLPKKSSADVSVSLLAEEERRRAKHKVILSPPQSVCFQGRPHDRIRRRSSEEPYFPAAARNFGGQLAKMDDKGSLKFAGPKSLAELKGAKPVKSFEVHSTKWTGDTISLEQHCVMSENIVESDGSLSFEGPSPLDAILKRKREDAPENGSTSRSRCEDNHRTDAVASTGHKNNEEDGIAAVGSSVSAATEEVLTIYVVESNDQDRSTGISLEDDRVRAVEEDDEEEEEGLIHSGDEDLTYGGLALVTEVLETENVMDVDNVESDHDLQNSVRDAESDYEAIEAEDFETEYDKIAYDEDEELDDDDDFARKLGVLFS